METKQDLFLTENNRKEKDMKFNELTEGDIMSITVEYITYNNKDFKQIIPCDDMEDAEMLKTQLEKLRHVSDVRITTDST